VSNQYKVAISYPLPGNLPELLAPLGSLQLWINKSSEILSREKLSTHARGCDGLIVTPADGPLGPEFFEHAGNRLKVISCYSVGFDYVDITAAQRRGIAVGITPEATTEPTADIAWLLILGASRNVTRAVRIAQSGRWAGIQPDDDYGTRVVGKTLFILGAGRIGFAVARRALGWNMKLLYAAQSAKPLLEAKPYHARRVSLDEGLRRADITSIHLPLNAHTEKIVNATALAKMKSGSILVNTSRGGIVDETALVGALSHGPLAAVGLDVYENEPRIHPELIAMENAFLLPHIGTATREDRQWMTKMAVDNLIAGVQGEPLPNSATGP